MRTPWTCLSALTLVVSLVGCRPAGDRSKDVDRDKVSGTNRRSTEESPTEKNVPAPSSRTHDSPAQTFPISLTDVTAASGIDFVHQYDGHDQRYIIEAVGSGMATLDYDSDGAVDVYFLNGSSLPNANGSQMSDALYRNLGGMKFANVTPPSRSGDHLFGMGVAVADFDSDGFSDILVTNFGPSRLLRNNGDGTFEDVSSWVATPLGSSLGAGACFFHADRDGHVDLFIGNYVKSPIEKNVQRTTEGFPSYPGPLDFETEPDLLLHNNADGTFTDISSSSGIASVSSTSMGSIAADIDNDGDTDLFVLNDVDRNFLFENDGSGHFVEVGIQRGVAFSHDGKRNGNMGVDCADVDGDAALDFFTTTFSNELPVLYLNDKLGNFMDATIERSAGVTLLPHANWGTAFFDVDNDADQDLFIANGHTDPNVSRWAYTTAWKVANTLLLNSGSGHFQDASVHSGSGLAPVESSRAVVAEDFDRDGDVDLIVLNALTQPTVIRNDSPLTSHWLQLDFRGRTCSRDGIGARVVLSAGGKQTVKEIHSGRGYQSSFGQRLHFGLGNNQTIDSVEIRWADGLTQSLKNLVTDQILTVIQPVAP